MKIYITADIEGVASTAKWQETSPFEKEYSYHCDEMTQEVLAACNAAIDAGTDEIYVRDAHASATNLDVKAFPDCVKIIRGWEGHPYMMVQGIDNSFDAIMYIGYHSEAGSPGNPLSHTMTRRTKSVKINGIMASEFFIFSMCAAFEGVPSVYLSGDRHLCETSRKLYPWLTVSPTKEGYGNSAVCMSPSMARKHIYDGVYKALSQNIKDVPQIEVPKEFNVEIEYKEHIDAAKMSYFPGAYRINSHTIGFETKDFDVFIKTLAYLL